MTIFFNQFAQKKDKKWIIYIPQFFEQFESVPIDQVQFGGAQNSKLPNSRKASKCIPFHRLQGTVDQREAFQQTGGPVRGNPSGH
jgi:hypothetical protein